MAAGRDSKGRIKKGYKLTKGGRVVKKSGSRRTRKRRSNPPSTRRRRRSTTSKGRTTVAKRRTRRRSPARRRRTYRRNQPAMVKNLSEGAISAFQVLAGKAAARTVADQVPIPGGRDSASGIAIQAVVAVLIGMFGRQLGFGASTAKMLTAGALTAPVETIIVGANVPFLSPALEAYPSVRELSAYPSGRDIAAYLPGQSEDVELSGSGWGW